MSMYEDAYKKVYGHKPSVSYVRGYFYVKGKGAFRRAALVKAAQILYARLEENDRKR